jgi:hypothetical protein
MNMNLKILFPYFLATVWSNYNNKMDSRNEAPIERSLYCSDITPQSRTVQTSEV